MKIRHADIKKCLMIKQSLKDNFNITPGKLLLLTKKKTFRCYPGTPNEKNIIFRDSHSRDPFLTSVIVEKNDSVMFLDVIFDTLLRSHVVRFLHNEKIIGTMFRKGKTVKEFEKVFTWEKGDE